MLEKGVKFGKVKIGKREAPFMRWRSGRGEQFIRRWRWYDSRSAVKQDGLRRKSSARNGDFGHFAHIAIFVYFIFLAWVIRFFRADSNGAWRKRRWLFRREMVEQIADGKGNATVCAVTIRGRRCIVFQQKLKNDILRVA